MKSDPKKYGELANVMIFVVEGSLEAYETVFYDRFRAVVCFGVPNPFPLLSWSSVRGPDSYQ